MLSRDVVVARNDDDLARLWAERTERSEQGLQLFEAVLTICDGHVSADYNRIEGTCDHVMQAFERPPKDLLPVRAEGNGHKLLLVVVCDLILGGPAEMDVREMEDQRHAVIVDFVSDLLWPSCSGGPGNVLRCHFDSIATRDVDLHVIEIPRVDIVVGS